ncbi:MAG: hypothetical protein AAF415_03975 [Pseudomonadota bacterium]
MTQPIEREPVSDEAILRYLDGHLPGGEREAFEATMASDGDLKARVAEMDLDFAPLQTGMAALLSGAPTFALPARRAPIWHYVAAAIVIFALGVGAGRLLPGATDSAGWHQAVADYQALYTTDTVAAVPMAPETRLAGLDRTGAALGLDLSGAAEGAKGLIFQRAQILQIDGKPLAQLVYLDATGAPIAFCITRREGADSAPKDGRLSGLNARTWRDAGYGFILIGDAAPDALRAATEELRGKIQL